MTVRSLGKLQRVDLREEWVEEDFTQWLAREENIALLGEAIGLDLEVEAQEKNVGPFRADILCKDTATEAWVLVENQLGRTDHTHLGQLLTYAAGLDAVTVVWIAQRFTDEHRAALDWLNEITDDRFSFFALEIELWRIGESPIAPKFNVVCKPNWSAPRPELSATKQLQLDYWTDFRTYLLDRGSFLKAQKPLPQHWTNLAMGRSHFHLVAFVNTQKKRLSCGLVLSGPEAKAHFQLLRADIEAIEAAMRTALDWRELPNKKESHILLHRRDADPANRADWKDQYAWLAETLEAFHGTFRPRVKELDADEYREAQTDE